MDCFEQVVKAAKSMDGCDPQWLKKRQEPNFVTVESGSDGSTTSPTMVLLHGLFGALSNWESVIPLFGKYTNPIALQFPLLDYPKSDIKVKALAVYTQYFLLKRQFGPVVLCGNSMGGHVALRLALAAPEMVRCLILSGTSGLYEHTVDALPVRPDKKFIKEHMYRVFRNERFITDEAIAEMYEIIKNKFNLVQLINAARSAKKDNLYDLLPEVKVPTLLLWGEDDEVTTMDVAKTFQERIPNSTLVTVKNCGHAPMIECPEWFSEQVKNFLDQVIK